MSTPNFHQRLQPPFFDDKQTPPHPSGGGISTSISAYRGMTGEHFLLTSRNVIGATHILSALSGNQASKYLAAIGGADKLIHVFDSAKFTEPQKRLVIEELRGLRILQSDLEDGVKIQALDAALKLMAQTLSFPRNDERELEVVVHGCVELIRACKLKPEIVTSLTSVVDNSDFKSVRCFHDSLEKLVRVTPDEHLLKVVLALSTSSFHPQKILSADFVAGLTHSVASTAPDELGTILVWMQFVGAIACNSTVDANFSRPFFGLRIPLFRDQSQIVSEAFDSAKKLANEFGAQGAAYATALFSSHGRSAAAFLGQVDTLIRKFGDAVEQGKLRVPVPWAFLTRVGHMNAVLINQKLHETGGQRPAL